MKNMMGNLELSFYMEDSSQEEMDQIFNEMADCIVDILLDYEIISDFDYQITQESHEVKNRFSDLVEYERQGGSLLKTAKEFLLSGLKKAREQ